MKTRQAVWTLALGVATGAQAFGNVPMPSDLAALNPKEFFRAAQAEAGTTARRNVIDSSTAPELLSLLGTMPAESRFNAVKSLPAATWDKLTAKDIGAIFQMVAVADKEARELLSTSREHAMALVASIPDTVYKRQTALDVKTILGDPQPLVNRNIYLDEAREAFGQKWITIQGK